MKTIIAAILFFTSAFAYADEEISEEMWIKYCTSLSATADLIMQYRQKNIAMSQAMADWKGQEQLVMAAYGLPKYFGKEAKDEAAVEFGSRVFNVCMREFYEHEVDRHESSERRRLEAEANG